jgi:hypothetical protein
MQFILSSKLWLTTSNEPNQTRDASYVPSPAKMKLSSSPVKQTVQRQLPAILHTFDRNGKQLALWYSLKSL